MKKIHVAQGLDLPLDWMLNATVVYGARGSGKTVFGSVLAEEVHRAGQRFCAIDLKGDFYGLKSSADGKAAAIPVVIFGGDHADVPLEADAGAFIGETVAGLAQSCVIDLEHFSKGKQVRFLTSFFLALYDHNRDPLMLLLDEGQRYAPQKPIDPDAAKCLGAVEDLVKLGRKHAIGVVLTTQRGSGLNKEVSELCELLVAFRTPGPLDQERIKGWLDANTTKAERESVMASLAGLPTGTAIFASGHPALRVFGTYRVRMRETFDSSATPKIGQRRSEPKKLAAPDLAVLREKMAAAIERAKADDPRALRARIVELERAGRTQIGAIGGEAKAAMSDAARLRSENEGLRAEVRALRARDKALRQFVGEHNWKSLHDRISAGLTNYVSFMQDLLRAFEAALPAETPAAAPPPSAPISGLHRSDLTPAQRPPHAPRMPRSAEQPPADGELLPGQQKILDALAWLKAIGVVSVDRVRLGFFADQSPKSSTYIGNIGALARAGLIQFPSGGAVSLTPAGSARARPPGPPLNDADLQALIFSKLKPGHNAILRALLDVHPGSLTREDLATVAGQSAKSSTYIANLGDLRSIGLIDYPLGGRVQASDLMFVPGAMP